MRYRQTLLAVKVFFIILIGGLFYIQIIRGEYYRNLSKRNIIRVLPLEAARGKIVDRNGIVLADTVASYAVSVIPQEMSDKTATFKALAQLLDVSSDEIAYAYYKEYLNPFTPVRVYESLDKERLIALEENKLFLPGVIIETVPLRIYPYGRVGAHVLGYLGKINLSQMTRLKSYGYQASDLIGHSGIEAYYDLFLRGIRGGEQVEVDNRGRKARLVGYKPPQAGTDIQISLDIRIQKIVDSLLRDKKGAVVLIDSFSGDIIAMSSQPSFDPEVFVNGDYEQINSLLADNDAPLFNRVVAGQYAPGSVFKVVVSLAALDKDPLFLNRVFYCNGSIEIGNRSFNCLSVHGPETMRDALVHSCNVYFYNLGILTTAEHIAYYATRLGLGKKTGVDLKYEAAGVMPSPRWRQIMHFKKWFKGDTANMSIGQGEVLVTPLQIACMISVLANDGRLVVPHFLKAIGHKRFQFPRDKDIVVLEKVRTTIASYLEEVVESREGTAHAVAIDGLTIAGKTGTAQVAGKESHGWFVGYVDNGEVNYSFCIFLEHAGSSHEACAFARVLFEHMIEEGLL